MQISQVVDIVDGGEGIVQLIQKETPGVTVHVQSLRFHWTDWLEWELEHHLHR